MCGLTNEAAPIDTGIGAIYSAWCRPTSDVSTHEEVPAHKHSVVDATLLIDTAAAGR